MTTLTWVRHELIARSSILVLVSLCSLGIPAASQSEVHFSFSPPLGTVFVETVRSMKTVTVWEQGVPQAQSSTEERKSHYLIRKTGAGYAVQVDPILPATKVSADAAIMIRDLISKANLTYQLNRQGRAIQVDGLDQAFESFKKALPPKLLDSALSGLGQAGKSIDQIAADQWNDRNILGIFAGNTMVLNQAAYRQITVPLAIGKSYPASLMLKATASTLCASQSCVRILFSYTSDDPSIGETMADMLRSMVVNMLQALAPDRTEELSGLPRFEFTDQKVVYEDVRLVDPVTGLPYGETETRTMQAMVGMEGQDKTKLETKERIEYSYRYE